MILPLSGANAQFGINSRQGLELAADEINAAGGIKALGGVRLKLVVADSTSQPTTAATVAQRLITQNRCVALIGAYASSLTLAVSEVTERRGIALLTMSFSDVLTERGYKHIPGRLQGIGAGQGAVRLRGVRGGGRAGHQEDRVAVRRHRLRHVAGRGTARRSQAAGADIVLDEAYPWASPT